MKLLRSTFVLTSAFLCCVSFAQAGSIGISHIGPGTGEGGSDGIASPVTLPGGAVPQSNWNNIDGASGSLSGLIDSAGNQTTANAVWLSVSGTGDTGGVTDTGDGQLMHGYLNADDQWASLKVSDLPAEIVALGYDVYVYHESQGGDGGIGYFTMNPNPSAFEPLWARDMDGSFGSGLGLVENGYDTLAEAEAGSGGNYVVFRGLTGDGFSLRAVGVTGNPRMPIQGIQIVPVPEPSTLVLAALGLFGLAMLGWRRRRA